VQDQAWWKETAAHLNEYLEKMAPVLYSHTHWRVRLSFAGLVNGVCAACSSALMLSVPVLIEALVILADDSYEQVADAGQAALARLSALDLQSDLVHLVQENLLALALTLPRRVRSGNDTSTLHALRLFAGYIQLLGPHVKVVVSSVSHLTRISTVLTSLLELDCASIHLIAERHIPLSVAATRSAGLLSLAHARPAPNAAPNAAPSASAPADKALGSAGAGWGSTGSASHTAGETHAHTQTGWRKQYVKFQLGGIPGAIAKVCRLLGYYGDAMVLLDHFMGVFRRDRLRFKQVGIIATDILLGAAHKKVSEGHKEGHTGAGAVHTHHAHAHAPTNDARTCAAAAQMILDELMGYDFERLPTKNPGQANEGEGEGEGEAEGDGTAYDDGHAQLSVAELTHNTQLVCITLEGIGRVSEVLGPAFDASLMTIM